MPDLASLAAGAGRWWLGEFLALFPPQLGRWLAADGARSLVLAPGDEAVSLFLLGSRREPLGQKRINGQDYSPAALERFLHSHGLVAEDVAIGIRMPRDKFFVRQVVLPVQAARSLATVLMQDLAKKTPIRVDDIHHDWVATPISGTSTIAVTHWVVRRDFVRDAAAAVGVDPARLAFVDCEGEAPSMTPPPIVGLERSRRRRSWVRPIGLALAASALLLGAAVGGMRYWRQQAALGELEAAVGGARTQAQAVRAAIDKLERKQAIVLRIRSQKVDMPGLLDAWEAATRALPRDTWLTELRLSEKPDDQMQRVAMTGFSKGAAALVGIVDRSPMFTDVSLTAPIALDPSEQRERFVLQATIKKREAQTKDSR
jgi:general secretion pathway protein L